MVADGNYTCFRHLLNIHVHFFSFFPQCFYFYLSKQIIITVLVAGEGIVTLKKKLHLQKNNCVVSNWNVPRSQFLWHDIRILIKRARMLAQ